MELISDLADEMPLPDGINVRLIGPSLPR